jgi:hypothetical protein
MRPETNSAHQNWTDYAIKAGAIGALDNEKNYRKTKTKKPTGEYNDNREQVQPSFRAERRDHDGCRRTGDAALREERAGVLG